MWIRTLSPKECTDLLAANRLGQLATSKDGRPYVTTIHYTYAESAIYAFSMPGKKIEWMRANPQVALLVEEHGQGKGWRSVILEGRYEELPDRIGYKRQRDHAWSILSKHANWWEPGGLKPFSAAPTDDSRAVFFRIIIEEVSGREARE